MEKRKEIIFINSHPIQYFTPLYKFMNESGIVTKAWYCSDESLRVGKDEEFGVEIKWDIPLLEGYEYKFFKNSSWKPSHSSGFFGLINVGMIVSLFKEEKSIVIIHGWQYFTHLAILILGRLCGHTVCVRCDNPLKQEVLKHGWKQKLKYFLFKYFLFPRIDKFLYVGEGNKQFYQSYGITEDKLMFAPYAVDNDRFQSEYGRLLKNTEEIRASFGINAQDKVIVFSGKYIDKKKPMDLLMAFDNLSRADCWLIMVGEGVLRSDMESLIRSNKISNVILTGFINQTKISDFYCIADLFVMCSALGENWGLSVNEAMNFDLPIIVSHSTGCSDDLVVNGANGFVVETGNVDELTKRIENILYDKVLSFHPSSMEIINHYDYSTMAINLRQLT